MIERSVRVAVVVAAVLAAVPAVAAAQTTAMRDRITSSGSAGPCL